MLLASVVTLIRWFLRATPESRSDSPYMTKDNAIVVGVSVAAILFLLLATHVVGLYAALILFLLFYLKFVGRHSWPLTGILTVSIPVFIFCLFEWALEDSAAQGDHGAAVLSDLRPDVLLTGKRADGYGTRIAGGRAARGDAAGQPDDDLPRLLHRPADRGDAGPRLGQRRGDPAADHLFSCRRPRRSSSSPRSITARCTAAPSARSPSASPAPRPRWPPCSTGDRWRRRARRTGR